MKIAFLNHTLALADPSFTGSDLQILLLARGMQSLEHEVFLLHETENSPRFPETPAVNFVYCQPVKHLKFFASTASYTRQLQQINPDVVITRGRTLLVQTASKWARRHGKVHVWTTNGEDSSMRWKRGGRLFRSGKPFYYKMLVFLPFLLEDLKIHRGIRAAHRVINQTETQRLQLQRIWNKKGVVIPSLTHFETKLEGEKENVVLWVAHIRKGKQPERFIHLARKLKHLRDWKFVLVGGTSDEAYACQLRQLAGECTNLEFTGQLSMEETSAWFQRARVFVNTSTVAADGLPNSFLQAWFSRVAVVSLNIDPNGWLSEKQAGCWAEGNDDLLGEQCLKLMAEPDQWEQLVTRAGQFARTTFDNTRQLEKFQQQLIPHEV